MNMVHYIYCSILQHVPLKKTDINLPQSAPRLRGISGLFWVSGSIRFWSQTGSEATVDAVPSSSTQAAEVAILHQLLSELLTHSPSGHDFS